MIKLGQIARASKSWSGIDVEIFSEISGDKNPIHLNNDFAANTIFKQRIVHGFLVGSLISSVIGNQLPGVGTIYLYQEMKFVNPVFINELVFCEVEVVDIIQEKHRAKLKTTCFKEDKTTVIEGFALVRFQNEL